MQKFLFIDRDGTIIVEPPIDFQVDSLEKLSFYPKIIRNLYRISQEMPYQFVMVTNQDGLGTISFPEEDFLKPHLKMLETLENENIFFKEILIDRTFPHENAITRKPNTGLLTHYLADKNCDLGNSFVIGDRITDMQLAYNMGAKGILIGNPSHDWDFPSVGVEECVSLISMDWDEIYHFLALENNLYSTPLITPKEEKDFLQMQKENNQTENLLIPKLNPKETKENFEKNRTAHIIRNTSETEIEISINLDGTGKYNLVTGVHFFDHMLIQIAKHAKVDLEGNIKGDLYIDEHHTIEDIGIALGEAFLKALGDKRGIARYGHFTLPMDESQAQVALDFSGRSFFKWKDEFKREKVGEMPVEMVKHFFESFANNVRMNLHISVTGENDHHQIEAIFKAFAKAIKMAIKIEGTEIPSSKGIL